MAEFDDLLNTVMQNYSKQLFGQIYMPNTLMERIDPDWIAERARLDAIGPEHHPNWHDLCEVKMNEFMPKFLALMEEYGAELSSYEEIDIHIGGAYRSWSDT